MATPPLPPQLDPESDDALPPGFPSNAERNWAVFCHLGGFAFYLLGFALGHILVPLALWLIKRDQSAFIEEHGREALNFQISVTLYAIVGGSAVFRAGRLSADPGARRLPHRVDDRGVGTRESGRVVPLPTDDPPALIP